MPFHSKSPGEMESTILLEGYYILLNIKAESD